MTSDDGKKESVSAADRRVASRHSTVKFVWYRVLSLESDGEDFPSEGISKTCDISETGIGLHAPRALPVGRIIFLEIATTEFNLSAIGKIIYSRPTTEGYHRVGVHLTIIPPNDRLLLMRHFKSHDEG
jgi:hypothetical protein